MPKKTKNQSPPLLDIIGLRKSFTLPDGGELKVLDEVNLSVHKGEIVGILGRSGSGKSTLLRLIAGLIDSSSGTMLFNQKPITEPAKGVAMVFQSFALFPWLSVIENVELGLEAMGIDAQTAKSRANKAIELIGLSGFSTAYPKELSGGMRQRVGFARALVVDPKLLLMDEPFSALDVLTAETLRVDFLTLWGTGKIPIDGIILVTHNIEESVLMCDRVVIFKSNPGHIGKEIAIDLPHPRDRQSEEFRQIVDDIYVEMTAAPKRALQAHQHSQTSVYGKGNSEEFPELDERLPAVTSSEMNGLLETLATDFNGHADLPKLAQTLQWEVDDLFPVAEGLQWFGLADVKAGDIVITRQGHDYLTLDTVARKKKFAVFLLANVPIAAHIYKVLNERPSHRAPWSRFLGELEDHLSQEEADTVLNTVIEWGRWGEVFQYDDSSGILSIEGDEP